MVRFNFGGSPAPNTNLPPDHPPVGPNGPDRCPVDDKARSRWLSAASLASSSSSSPSSSSSLPPPNARPSIVNTPAASTFGMPDSSPSSSSRQAPGLSKEREISTIPRAPIGTTPIHVGSSEGSGSDEDQHWVYPSELQFFQAMARKQHKPKQGDMRNVVQIHNQVNEKSWESLLRWEHGMGSEKCGGPRLVSFAGMPDARSPKAYLYMALGYSAPFDRHDWIIDRCGTNVRYVIDYYTGRQDAAHPDKMAFFIDVRPAIDTRVGFITRVVGLWRYYIAGY